MAEQQTAPAAGDSVAGAAGAGSAPRMILNAQYLKASSFEIPGAPIFFAQRRTQPLVEISFDVRVMRLSPDQPHFEVSVVIVATATSSVVNAADQPVEGPTPAYNCNIAYAGIVSLADVPADVVDALLFVEAPRLLFPAARNQIADITRDAGMTPLLLQPFDFSALFEQKRTQGA
ncbi:preprotein translocase subunit SecB [Endobacter medicaginis]|uniref:Preprotein translocase subunit SecB n=1 Tax=Endobacter medicaginis TaxID=1181271 RepID=A0A850NLK0_9PROT|nr:protein-export chaperone SecB [Endobacter medicaginis]MBB3174723.1 preprotein translocase subunit SecB [Endobacter medicaginis]MCX5474882.1 protein-export chaperone SecB [Endobacter medicaginis]NVN30671.1 protein-export chaperone SecB [Endobacter medicaginis]